MRKLLFYRVICCQRHWNRSIQSFKNIMELNHKPLSLTSQMSSLNYMRNLSKRTMCNSSGSDNNNSDNESPKSAHENNVRKDPELSKLLKEITQDFGDDKKKTLKHENDDDKSSKVSKYGDFSKIGNEEERRDKKWTNVPFRSAQNIKFGDFRVESCKKTETEITSDNIVEDFCDFSQISEEVQANGDSVNNSGSHEKLPTVQKAITDQELDKMLSTYNIEEFYGVEPTIVQEEQPSREDMLSIPLERGRSGVIEVDELVTVLNEDKMADVCVIRVPPERQYVDYMVIGTGKSARHMMAVAGNVKWIYKKKRTSTDPKTVHIEGVKSNDWLAMDLGNIALHLMMPQTRKLYDLETLWTCGTDYDRPSLEKAQEELYTVRLTSDLSLHETKQVLIDNIKRLQKERDSNVRDGAA